MDNNEILERAKQVLTLESNAIVDQREDVGEEYLQVFNSLKNRKGKVVFSGVGKSGHIGEKLAATFASLGITAIFVHSTEAVHGDLGMIEQEDLVFLLSNSGSTKEVLAVLPALKKIGCQTIAFTSNQESLLAKNCDLVLSYIYGKEADQNNLAPTTSAVVMLALGDSLAVALSEENGFTSDDFYVFHPGGALGEQLREKEKEI